MEWIVAYLLAVVALCYILCWALDGLNAKLESEHKPKIGEPKGGDE